MTKGNGSFFDKEQRHTAEAIIAKYPNSRSAVLPLLFFVQSIKGHVTEDGMRAVAAMLDITPAQVLAASSFYTMLRRRPQGKYLISVCRNISCTHMGAHKVIDALSDRLGVAPGSCTADGKFELETAECLATCDGAPSMQINYEDFYVVTASSAVELVDKLERGEEVRSERGEEVRSSKEISFEIATAGARLPGSAGEQTARTVGGEFPRSDMAPGTRPKLDHDEEEGHGG